MSGAPLPVTDLLSNFNDQLVAASKIVGRSKHRQIVFEAVYKDQKQVKTVKEIMTRTGLSQIQVLKAGGRMAGLLFIHVPGGYKKKQEFSSRYRQILSMSIDPKKLDKMPTKISPKVIAKNNVKVIFPRAVSQAKTISVDDIDSFSKVTKIAAQKSVRMGEKKMKEGFQKITGESYKTLDWGGERSDCYTTRFVYNGKRIPTAIAFKGAGTTGKLVPSKMGKNGDQISRLFVEPAELFLIVYCGPIDSMIISQMQAYAMGKALGGRRILYGVIDGIDLGRLITAYPKQFRV